MATTNSRKSTTRRPPATKPAAAKASATRASRPRAAKAKPGKASNSKSLAIAGALLGAVAAGVYGLFRLGRGRSEGGHIPTDLMGDQHPGPDDRAVDAFRPDPTAPIPAGERDAFRPAFAGASAPTLVKGQARENERLDAMPA